MISIIQRIYTMCNGFTKKLTNLILKKWNEDTQFKNKVKLVKLIRHQYITYIY